jgi:predicted ABC-type ATPase
MTEKKPTLCMVAGPNGSGKTTTTIQSMTIPLMVNFLFCSIVQSMAWFSKNTLTISPNGHRLYARIKVNKFANI